MSYCSSKQRSGREKGPICQGKTHCSLSFILISYPGRLLFGVSGGPGPSRTLRSSELSPSSGSLSVEWENPNSFPLEKKNLGQERAEEAVGAAGLPALRRGVSTGCGTSGRGGWGCTASQRKINANQIEKKPTQIKTKNTGRGVKTSLHPSSAYTARE